MTVLTVIGLSLFQTYNSLLDKGYCVKKLSYIDEYELGDILVSDFLEELSSANSKLSEEDRKHAIHYKSLEHFYELNPVPFVRRIREDYDPNYFQKLKRHSLYKRNGRFYSVGLIAKRFNFADGGYVRVSRRIKPCGEVQVFWLSNKDTQVIPSHPLFKSELSEKDRELIDRNNELLDRRFNKRPSEKQYKREYTNIRRYSTSGI